MALARLLALASQVGDVYKVYIPCLDAVSELSEPCWEEEPHQDLYPSPLVEAVWAKSLEASGLHMAEPSESLCHSLCVSVSKCFVPCLGVDLEPGSCI